jgi:integrase
VLGAGDAGHSRTRLFGLGSNHHHDRSIGWHTFRHSYRSLLSEEETPLDVQQKLMRHAHLSTTEQYGGPPMENRRKANSRVVRQILSRKSSR